MKKFYSIVAAVLLLPTSAFAEGIDVENATQLFDKNLSEIYATDFRNTHPTLAACGEALVLNFGDGTTPVYLNPLTGEKLGEINLGSADATGAVASDCVGNMLICNSSPSGSTFKVWKTSSVTDEPVEIISLEHNTSLDLGIRLHVQGNLNGDALIVATMTGLWAQHIYRWQVSNGVVGEGELVEIDGVNQWDKGSNNTKVIAHSAKAADGYYLGHYYSGDDKFYYVDGTTNTATNYIQETNEDAAWAYTPNACDARSFNGKHYTAVQELSLFTGWSVSSYVYIYETTDPSNLTGAIGENALKEIEMTIFEAAEGATPADMAVVDNYCDPTGDVLLFPYGDNLLAYFVTSSDLDLAGYAFPINSGVSTVAADGFRAYGANGAIVVENGGKTVEVFNAAGAVVARTNDSQISVAPGIYFVKVAGKTQKVLVK